MTAITIDAVARSFGDVRAVDGASLAIRDGEFFTLLGPSGCGKTTLLRMVAGFCELDRGRILFGERATTPVTDAERRVAFQEFRTQKLLPRVLAGLTALSAQPQVDTQRMAAIGFWLGKMTALELARFGGR